MEINKIKRSKGEVEINYRTHLTTGDEERILKSSDEPRSQMIAAFAELRPDVIRVCELDAEDVERIEVLGASIKWRDGEFSVVLTATKSLISSDTKLLLNTPLKQSDGKSSTLAMPDGMAKRVRKVIEEAKHYLEGNRAQMTLFNPGASHD